MILSKFKAYWQSCIALQRVHKQGLPLLAKSPGSPFNREAYNIFLCEAVQWRLKPDAVICDVGANNGDFSQAFSMVYPKAKIILFEPISDHLAKLHSLRELKSFPWEIQPCALGAKAEKLTIEIPDAQAAASSLLGFSSAYLDRNPSASKTTTTQCDVRRLDDVWQEVGGGQEIDLLKIDVEGFEFSVLEGAQMTLPMVKNIIVEVSLLRHSDSPECPIAKMVAIASHHGLSLFRMEPTILGSNSIPLEYDLYFQKTKKPKE